MKKFYDKFIRISKIFVVGISLFLVIKGIVLIFSKGLVSPLTKGDSEESWEVMEEGVFATEGGDEPIIIPPGENTIQSEEEYFKKYQEREVRKQKMREIEESRKILEENDTFVIERRKEVRIRERLEDSREVYENSADQVRDISRKAERQLIEELKTLRKSKNLNGGLGYVMPDSMDVGSYYNAYAVIENECIYNAIKAELRLKTQYQELIATNKVKPRSLIIQSDSIPIYDVMKVELIDHYGEQFEIRLISSESQVIDAISSTVWKWNIKPLEGGTGILHIKVTAKVATDIGTAEKDVIVYSKLVTVNSNLMYSCSMFFVENWEWGISALAFPFLLWLTNLFRKRKKRGHKLKGERIAGFLRDKNRPPK